MFTPKHEATLNSTNDDLITIQLTFFVSECVSTPFHRINFTQIVMFLANVVCQDEKGDAYKCKV